MADAKITHKPGGKEKVYGLVAPQRGSGGSHAITVKWSLGKWATDKKNSWRIEGFDIHFEITLYDFGKKKSRKIHYQTRTSNTSRRDWTLYFDTGVTCTDKKTYRRDRDFYPATNVAIRSITAKLRTYNGKGTGDWVTSTSKFVQPYTPTIESITQVGDTGRVQVKVKHNKGQNWHETWRTDVTMKVWYSKDRKYLPNLSRNDYITTATESKTFEVLDVYQRMAQSYDQYLSFDVTAVTKGLWGDSKAVTKNLYISWPWQPSITSVSAARISEAVGESDGGQRYLNSKITFGVKLDQRTEDQKAKGIKNAHPATGVRLQKLVNVDYEREVDIPGDADWKDCGAVDNGSCTALSSTVAELQPERGKKTWVRVKAWNQVEEIFYRYSNVRRMTELERAPRSASEARVTITNAQSGEDGKSAVVDIAWEADEATGTEISWSDSVTSWRSTDEPSTYRVDYDDGPKAHEGTDYPHSARVHIANLTEGTTYHVRARRYYVDEDDNESFGAYYPADVRDEATHAVIGCGTVPVTPVTSPRSVVLSAPAFVRRGASIPLNWTFDSEAEQTGWELITGTVAHQTVVVDGREMVVDRIDETNRESTDPQTGETEVTTATVVHLAGGTDAMGSFVLPYDAHLEEIINPPGTEPDDEIPLAVRVKTGGDFVTSDAVSVRLADPPTLVVGVADVAAQPMTVDLACNVPASVSIVVSADAISGEYAGGPLTQTHGDTIWSMVSRFQAALDDEGNVIDPGWTYDQGDGLYHASITAEMGLDLLDGGRYMVTAKATDVETGLVSDEATCEFDVDYARKAPMPSEGITVTPYDRVDADSGMRQRGCEIALVAPEDGVATDLYDVYRVTADGPQLCARGVPTDATVDDRLAPFGDEGELTYRVCCRTVDGCEEYLDYAYRLPGEDMRIDFGEEYVELPYNLRADDSYEKDFEARRHLDGSVDGYWNEGATRTASLSTDLIRVTDEDKVRAVRRLARHCGPTYLRLADGTAYQADVQVRGLGREATSAAVAVSISATEVGLTEDCMATVNVLSDEPEPEP